MNTMLLVPAYGRDYKSKAAVQADLDADKDFEVVAPYGTGRYANRKDLINAEQTQVTIRYAQLRKVAIFEVKQ